MLVCVLQRPKIAIVRSMRSFLSSVPPRVLACLWFCACGGDKPDAQAAASGPIVGVLELPISLRTAGAAPADFHDVEI
jgi:hypothetical protein